MGVTAKNTFTFGYHLHVYAKILVKLDTYFMNNNHFVSYKFGNRNSMV